MKTLLFFLLFRIVNAHAYVESSNADLFAGKTEMNGYKYSTFSGFEKKWKLVTVRYRQDSKEMRFTYANSLALKTLLSGETDYPDGSIFGKIGLITEEDTAFISSRVPSGARRYQLMIRDRKKHSDTGGWGYVLFDGTGRTFPEDPKLKIQACVACHQIVPERGFVFSQPMDTTLFIKSLQSQTKSGNKSGITFLNIPTAKIGSGLKEHLEDSSEVLLLDGNIRKYIFQGTLDEIIPALISESEKKQKPTALASQDFKRFTLILPKKKNCPNHQDGFEIIQTQYEKDNLDQYKIKTKIICR